jgi:hypothetical protein
MLSSHADDLVAFFDARLYEDEALARRGFSHPERWVRVAPFGIPTGISCSAVLREVEAKRRIVKRYLAIKAEVDAREADGYPANVLNREAMALHDAIRDLATAYADHPDCRPEWRLPAHADQE